MTNEADLIKEFSACKLQAVVRRFLVRCEVLEEVIHRYEKIYDPKRRRHYYYDKIKDKSSWIKPALLLKRDMPDVAPTYTQEQASIKLVNALRRIQALNRVRLLYQNTIMYVTDEKTGQKYYYNPLSGNSMYTLPAFMNGRLDYKKATIKKKSKRKTRGEDDEENEFDDDDEEEEEEHEESDLESVGLSDTSSTILEKRRKKRRFPRSRLQEIIDAAEDNISETFELDISNFGTKRFTSRIYDLVELTRLNMSYNQLKKLSPNIQYLLKLEIIDLRHNRVQSIPEEIEELQELRELYLGYNNLSHLPGRFYKLKNLEILDLSHNQFEELPVESGNLELLKELNEWNVGIKLLNKLTKLDLSYNQLTTWPSQVEELSNLESLNISFNQIQELSEDIHNMKKLQIFLSYNNKLTSLPSEIYTMTSIQEIRLQYNQIESLPQCDNPLIYELQNINILDLSNNSFQMIDQRIGIFLNLQYLYLQNNNITLTTSDCFSRLEKLKVLNISHNSLVDFSISLKQLSYLTECDMSHNQLSEFPIGLSSCYKIKSLSLHHNKLPEIVSKYLVLMNDLERLELQYNQITLLPALMFTIKKLVYVDLSFNRISNLPSDVGNWKRLQYLSLSHNSIILIPKEIKELNELIVLELDHNNLVNLPIEIQELGKLKKLSLENNNFEQSLPIMYILPQLLSCSLSWNWHEDSFQNKPSHIFYKNPFNTKPAVKSYETISSFHSSLPNNPYDLLETQQVKTIDNDLRDSQYLYFLRSAKFKLSNLSNEIEDLAKSIKISEKIHFEHLFVQGSRNYLDSPIYSDDSPLSNFKRNPVSKSSPLDVNSGNSKHLLFWYNRLKDYYSSFSLKNDNKVDPPPPSSQSTATSNTSNSVRNFQNELLQNIPKRSDALRYNRRQALLLNIHRDTNRWPVNYENTLFDFFDDVPALESFGELDPILMDCLYCGKEVFPYIHILNDVLEDANRWALIREMYNARNRLDKEIRNLVPTQPQETKDNLISKQKEENTNKPVPVESPPLQKGYSSFLTKLTTFNKTSKALPVEPALSPKEPEIPEHLNKEFWAFLLNQKDLFKIDLRDKLKRNKNQSQIKYSSIESFSFPISNIFQEDSQALEAYLYNVKYSSGAMEDDPFDNTLSNIYLNIHNLLAKCIDIHFTMLERTIRVLEIESHNTCSCIPLPLRSTAFVFMKPSLIKNSNGLNSKSKSKKNKDPENDDEQILEIEDLKDLFSDIYNEVVGNQKSEEKKVEKVKPKNKKKRFVQHYVGKLYQGILENMPEPVINEGESLDYIQMDRHFIRESVASFVQNLASLDESAVKEMEKDLATMDEQLFMAPDQIEDLKFSVFHFDSVGNIDEAHKSKKKIFLKQKSVSNWLSFYDCYRKLFSFWAFEMVESSYSILQQRGYDPTESIWQFNHKIVLDPNHPQGAKASQYHLSELRYPSTQEEYNHYSVLPPIYIHSIQHQARSLMFYRGHILTRLSNYSQAVSSFNAYMSVLTKRPSKELYKLIIKLYLETGNYIMAHSYLCKTIDLFYDNYVTEKSRLKHIYDPIGHAQHLNPKELLAIDPELGIVSKYLSYQLDLLTEFNIYPEKSFDAVVKTKDGLFLKNPKLNPEFKLGFCPDIIESKKYYDSKRLEGHLALIKDNERHDIMGTTLQVKSFADECLELCNFVDMGKESNSKAANVSSPILN